MKIRTKAKRGLVFDCHKTGHTPDPSFLLRNSNAPNVIGIRCVKCRCLIYESLPEVTEPESRLVLPETVMAEVGNEE